MRGVSKENIIPLSGTYTTIGGTLYFVVGKTRIKVTEHFPKKGPQLSDLLEDVITYTAKTA